MKRIKHQPAAMPAAASPLPVKTLMLNWLKAWRDEAKARSSYSTKTFHQAYTALLHCPLDFQHPAQLRQLEGVGKTLEHTLTQKLKQFCSDNDVPMPKKPRTETIADSSDSDAPMSKGKSKSSSSSAAAPKKRLATSKASTSALKPRVKPKKAYVPQTRSGAYGLLVALYSATLDVPQEGCEAVTSSWLSKARLIQLATPYADVAYLARPIAPGAPGFGAPNFNTAWNAMKTLITRGYVYRTGNPPKFSLSKQGFDVAAECAEMEQVDMRCSAIEQEEEEEEEAEQQEEQVATAKGKGRSHKGNKTRSTSSSSSTSASSAFRFIYLTDARPPLRVLQRSRAALRLSDRDYTPTYHVEFPRALREHVFVRMCIEDVHGDEAAATLQGWAREMGANEKAPGLGHVEETAPPKTSSTTSTSNTAKLVAQSSSKAASSKTPTRLKAHTTVTARQRDSPASSPELAPALPPTSMPVPAAAAAAEPAPRARGLQIPPGMRPRARSRIDSDSRSAVATAARSRAATPPFVLSDSDSSTSDESELTGARERERERNVQRQASLSPSLSSSPPPPSPRQDAQGPRRELPSSPGFEEDVMATQSQAQRVLLPASQQQQAFSKSKRTYASLEVDVDLASSDTSSPVFSQVLLSDGSHQPRTGAVAKRKSKQTASPKLYCSSDSDDDDLPPLSTLLNGTAVAAAAAASKTKQAQHLKFRQPTRKKPRSSAEVIDLS